jgi:predicted thioesterase
MRVAACVATVRSRGESSLTERDPLSPGAVGWLASWQCAAEQAPHQQAHVTGGHPITTTARHRASPYRPGIAAVGTRQMIHYRVRRKDLASRIYRSLGKDRWKPAVFATARLLWLCELAIMGTLPGISLGTEMTVRHRVPTVRGAVVTVMAVCIARQDNYWDWHVEVRDISNETLALCTLRFVSNIDRRRYRRRLARKIADRSLRLSCWLRILDALSLITIVAIPFQMTYLWQDWTSRLLIETLLVVGWLLALAGVPCAIVDWITVRRAAGKSDPRHR